MWIFLPDGFLSVVANKDDPESPLLLVRARKREHIEKLLGHVEPEIIEGAGSDYLFRAWVPRHAVQTLLFMSVEEMRYPNFKDSIFRSSRVNPTRAEEDYHDACLDVWHAMHAYQSQPRAWQA